MFAKFTVIIVITTVTESFHLPMAVGWETSGIFLFVASHESISGA
jgi:hypothetical protein